MMVSLEDGTMAVRAARQIAEAETEGKSPEYKMPESFAECDGGVFVTLNEYPSGILRACIGYPEPPFKLDRTLLQTSRAVCYDERFPPLKTSHAKKCTFEVTFLTPLEKIEYDTLDELKSKIEIGKDGLSMRYVRNMGLIHSAIYLPQVPVEQGWNINDYLSNICMKAGLQEDAWKSGALEFFKFQGEVYGETSPCGDIVRK